MCAELCPLWVVRVQCQEQSSLQRQRPGSRTRTSGFFVSNPCVSGDHECVCMCELYVCAQVCMWMQEQVL